MEIVAQRWHHGKKTEMWLKNFPLELLLWPG